MSAEHILLMVCISNHVMHVKKKKLGSNGLAFENHYLSLMFSLEKNLVNPAMMNRCKYLVSW